jgi:hypothetical protein
MPSPSSKANAAADRAWLAGDPPASEIRARFPAEWATVQRELTAVIDASDVEAIKRYAARVASGGGGPAVRNDREAVRVMARQRLAADALRQMGVAAATGVTGGRLRFGLVSGWITQRLLFAGGGLERKPVSMRAFRLLWPLVRHKSYLMPLVEPRGIYCFYSRELVRGLRELIGDRAPCVEIAAGDGTLSRFLRAEGVDVVATDDHSWQKTRREQVGDVVVQDAVAALRERAPRVVLCSWPPAGNPFEAEVFRTASVELYVVIGSRSEFAAGNWDAYRAATAAGWTLEEDEALSALVLPPQIASAVWVFRRRVDG